MKFCDIFKFIENTYFQAIERPRNLQNCFYREKHALMPSRQSEAQHSVQAYAPQDLSPNMTLFRERIPFWQNEILKKKSKLKDIDIYNAHVFASLDVKNTRFPSHHCSGFLLYQAGVLAHQMIRKAGVQESFSSKLVSTAAHTFNNIEERNALNLRHLTFGAIAIGGALMMSFPSRLFSPFAKNITKIAANLNQNPSIKESYITVGNNFSKAIKLLGKSMISTSMLLFADEHLAKDTFIKNASSKELFQKYYGTEKSPISRSIEVNKNLEEMIQVFLLMNE